MIFIKFKTRKDILIAFNTISQYIILNQYFIERIKNT